MFEGTDSVFNIESVPLKVKYFLPMDLSPYN
jgi:hypothetical protein